MLRIPPPAVLVVGEHLDQQGAAARSIGFVGEFLVIDTLEVTGAFLDGAIDIVLGHVGAASLENGGAQARIALRIAAAHARSDRNFLYKLREHLTALRIERAFLCFMVAHLLWPDM